MKRQWLGLLSAFLLLSGCNECENGFKVKTEYKYVTIDQFWYKSPKDELLDGAIRVSTSTTKHGRTLTLRCFEWTTEGANPRLDIRYVINAPLLKRVVPELEKAGNIVMVLSVDGTTIGSIKVRPISHDFGISFLGDIKLELLERIAGAAKFVVAMPRQGSNKLDDVVEFGVAELSEHIQPVKKACEATGPEAPSSPAPVQSVVTKKT